MQKRFRKAKSILRGQKGTTMVELVVSFLLLAIFLTCVTMVISNALTTYYREQRLMSIYSVADTVLKEARDDITRMQGSGMTADGRERKGYVKLRSGAAGSTVKSALASVDMHGQTVTGSIYVGDTIEFLQANETDGFIMEQIDSFGSKGSAMIDKDGIKKQAADVEAAIPKNQLTARYYLPAGDEATTALKGMFMDQVLSSSSVKGNYSGATNVLWDAEDRLPDGLYQGFPVSVSFAVETHTEGTDVIADRVTVFVKVYEKSPDDPDNLGNAVYQKEGVINLQNTVFYKTDDTTYYDTTLATP